VLELDFCSGLNGDFLEKLAPGCHSLQVCYSIQYKLHCIVCLVMWCGNRCKFMQPFLTVVHAQSAHISVEHAKGAIMQHQFATAAGNFQKAVRGSMYAGSHADVYEVFNWCHNCIAYFSLNIRRRCH
jgi:hypothetical protein